MESLKRIIISRLQWLAMLMVLLVLPLASTLQVLVLQNQARDNAQSAFQQIHQILKENTQELETVTAEYRETCLHNAESIAYMIQHHPEILGNLEEFHRIAHMMEVDEIHIFDKTGRIFTGTHPEYYDFTFETGEQIGFFAPLLEDKSLRLCQDITPNTAEGKLVQYSALWSADGEFIVQVGMYPATVLEYTQKNELSYIFSLLQGSAGVELYAIDRASGIILGSTSGSDNGRDMAQIGLNPALMESYKRGTLATVGGVDSYCMFTDMDGTLIGYTISTDALYHSLLLYIALLAVCMGLIVCIVMALMWRFTRSYILSSLDQVNATLGAITGGNLDERVKVHSSLEFSQLSSHINDMVHSILSTTDKMGFVLDHADMPVGVYEYSTKMKGVRFTEHLPGILGWSSSQETALASNRLLFQQYLEQLRSNPVPDEKGTYRPEGEKEVYIKLDEVSNGSDTLGILIDVTENILTRRRIERERDIDLLTGLYNRRALERELSSTFQQDMGQGVLIMIDSDNLKTINDLYGHTIGDRYIRRIAQVISTFGSGQRVAARFGGDEFVLLLYGYSSEAAILQELETLRYEQKHTYLTLEDGSQLPVRFSFGYVLTGGRKDYSTMLTEADGHMYAVKRKRKQAQARESELV